jgi:hypothetical protein
MRFNGEFWEGNTASTTDFGTTLTVEKIEASMRQMRRMMESVEPTAVDLYPHDLGLDKDGKERMFELGKEAFELIGEKRKRRFLVVPRNRMDWIADALRKAGVDVRISPTVRDTPAAPEPGAGQ